MKPLFHTDCSISDSLKSVRKSVLIYETIIVQRRELAKLLERTILFLEENQHTLFSDVIEKPFLLVSKMFWDVSKMYKVPVRGKEMVLLDGVNGFAEIYCMPVYPRYRCLSEERTKEWEK